MESCKPYGRNPYCRGNNQTVNNNRQMRNNNNCNSCNAINQIMNSSVSDCGCNDNNSKMKHMPLAMGYIPMQSWGELYDPETALCQGTAFPDLNLVFCGSRGKM